MTLNANHIRELLDQTTPGPWVTVGECFIDKDGNERYSPELISSRADGIGRDVMWNTDEAVSWCSNSHDPQLAALAPELARDWLRMRHALKEMREIVKDDQADFGKWDTMDAQSRLRWEIHQIHNILNGVTND